MASSTDTDDEEETVVVDALIMAMVPFSHESKERRSTVGGKCCWCEAAMVRSLQIIVVSRRNEEMNQEIANIVEEVRKNQTLSKIQSDFEQRPSLSE